MASGTQFLISTTPSLNLYPTLGPYSHEPGLCTPKLANPQFHGLSLGFEGSCSAGIRIQGSTPRGFRLLKAWLEPLLLATGLWLLLSVLLLVH